jgi:hypothetical protein
MPMTYGDPNSCTSAGIPNQGWRYCFTNPTPPAPTLPFGQASNPFDTHGDLHTYWTGNGVLPPNSSGIWLRTVGGQYTSVIVGRATTGVNNPANPSINTLQTDLNPPNQAARINLGAGTVNNPSALSTQVILLLNQNGPTLLKMGDYITMLNTSGNMDGAPPQGGPFHGLMVIGWGEALSCEDAIFGGTTNNGLNATAFKRWTVDQFAETYAPSNTIALNQTIINNPVPWVVDFTAPPDYSNNNQNVLQETQNPVPRPFYCTMYRDFQLGGGARPIPPVDFFFPHDWQFFTLPDQVVFSNQSTPLNQLYIDPNWGW